MRNRLVALDGLRGLAALFVVLYHYLPARTGLAAHGYLAVDFFFLLSGFVICKAYEPALADGLGFGRFTVRRIIRLYPMVLVGTAIGLSVGLLGWVRSGVPPWPIHTVLANAALLPDVWGGRADLFPLDSPMWSLFFELVISLAYAAFLYRFSDWSLLLLVAIAAAVTILGVYRTGSLDLGSTRATFLYGLPRTAASFGAGIWIARNFHSIGRLPFAPPLWATCLILIVAFALPPLPVANWVTDLLSAYVVFPAVILAIAVTHPDGGRLSHWMGELSYPLYAIHFPFRSASALMLGPLHLGAGPVLAIQVIGVVAAAFGTLLAFDRPVRRYLSKMLAGGSSRPIALASAP